MARDRSPKDIDNRITTAQTVFAIWTTYRDHVIPPVAPPVQVEECRRAFYAGAAAALELMLRVGDDAVSEDTGAEMLANMEAELKAFAHDLAG